MTPPPPPGSAPEAAARVLIDAAFAAAGWVVQDRDEMNLAASRGVAVREFKLKQGHGYTDYLLFVDGKAVGVLEAKHAGHTLSGVEPQSSKYATGLPDGLNPPIRTQDALRNEPGDHADVVLTNPPFGKKCSVTVFNEAGETDKESLTYNRPDFWVTTSNKQLNFVQHVKSLLKIHGRAAVVVPDNVLFEGGAGETVRRKLLHECDVHTLLRLPTGIFYAQGVKANVLFFERKPGSDKPWTKKVWVYDHRTNCHYTLKTKTMTRANLDEFVDCYRPGDRHNRKPTWSETQSPAGRWRAYTFDEISARDKCSLDLFWLRDESLEDSASLPDPHILAQEIADDLRSALGQIEDILGDLEQRVTGQAQA